MNNLIKGLLLIGSYYGIGVASRKIAPKFKMNPDVVCTVTSIVFSTVILLIPTKGGSNDKS